MFSQLEEHFEYEANASYDYVREAYSATALDLDREGYCDYLNMCEQAGSVPLEFAEWLASLKQVGPRQAPPCDWADDEEIPF